jgi:DDE superfamily endonuclease
MLTRPVELLSLLGVCAPLCSRPVGEHAQVLWVGARLATGKRTVTACVRVMGWSHETRFVNDHRGLNRARWSAWGARHLLLRLLIMPFAPQGGLVFGLDETIERRRGDHSKAQGISRAPVRASHPHMVTASGLRWLGCRLWAHVPWAGSVGGWPCLTGLGPSERSQEERGRRHQKLPERARQSIRWRTRWWPDRPLLFVGDGSWAVLALRHTVRHMPQAPLMTRWRLDAEWWHPAPERKPRHNGRPRVTGARRPSPHQRLEDPHTPWMKRAVAPGYGGAPRAVETYTATWVG